MSASNQVHFPSCFLLLETYMLNRPTTWAAKLCHIPIPGNEIFVKFQWRSSLLNQKQSSIRKKSFIPHLPFPAFAVWMVNTKSGDATTILKQEDQVLHAKDGDAKKKKAWGQWERLRRPLQSVPRAAPSVVHCTEGGAICRCPAWVPDGKCHWATSPELSALFPYLF